MSKFSPSANALGDIPAALRSVAVAPCVCPRPRLRPKWEATLKNDPAVPFKSEVHARCLARQREGKKTHTLAHTLKGRRCSQRLYVHITNLPATPSAATTEVGQRRKRTKTLEFSRRPRNRSNCCKTTRRDAAEGSFAKITWKQLS